MITDLRGGVSPPQVWQLVRGDDTQVVGKSYHDVLAVKIGYDVLGAVANESKFTLRQGCTEFLRIETEDKLRGYPCRTVRLVTQRRPWSARPLNHEAALDHTSKCKLEKMPRLIRSYIGGLRYSLLLDESQDVSDTKQLWISVHLLSSETNCTSNMFSD